MASAFTGDEFLRQTSSRSWRSSASMREIWNAPTEVFERSSRRQTAEEEEEELKWAAIKRLPTYERVRKGMLKHVRSGGKFVHEEVDVTKIGSEDKKQLMNNILKVVEEDNERFLTRIRARTDRFVPI